MLTRYDEGAEVLGLPKVARHRQIVAAHVGAGNDGVVHDVSRIVDGD